MKNTCCSWGGGGGEGQYLHTYRQTDKTLSLFFFDGAKSAGAEGEEPDDGQERDKRITERETKTGQEKNSGKARRGK